MQTIKNIPTTPSSLKELIDIRPGRVISMSLSKREDVQMMLLSVSEGEEVSEEQYDRDMVYYVFEGCMPLEKEGNHYELHEGDIMVVEANIPHAIGGKSAFKVFQISMNQGE